jgi:hypothetical protein
MLRLDVNDLPPALADLGSGERRHCAGRGEHKRGARLGTLDFSRGRNEGALLDLGAGYVVENAATILPLRATLIAWPPNVTNETMPPS